MKFGRMLALAAALAVPGTALAQGSSSTPTRSNRDFLTRAQLDSLHVESVYDAVEAIRSMWLRERGPSTLSARDSLSGTVPLVYLDNVKLGTVSELKRIPIRDVFSVQHLGGPEANGRYGVGHGAGVILVSTLSSKPEMHDQF